MLKQALKQRQSSTSSVRPAAKEAMCSVLSVLCIFFFLQNLHAFLLPLLREALSPIKESSFFPLVLIAAERLLYACIYCGGAYLCFHKLLAHKLECRNSVLDHPKRLRARLVSALSWAMAAAFLCFCCVIFLDYLDSHYFGSIFSWQEMRAQRNLEIALHRSRELFLWHILWSAFVTAALEEFFYRGCIQRWLQNRISPLPALLVSVCIFSFAHARFSWIMFAPALCFSLVFWRRGLLCAILTHAFYNSMILGGSAMGF